MNTLARLNVVVTVFVTLSFLTGTKADAQSCVGSETFYTCTDAQGNSYSVSKMGGTTLMNGSNSQTGARWNQTSSTFGSQTFTTGTASDGGRWNMNQTNFGNGWTSTTGRDSDGNSFNTLCGPTGCN